MPSVIKPSAEVGRCDGTNGKTTIAHLWAMRGSTETTGVIGTLGAGLIGDLMDIHTRRKLSGKVFKRVCRQNCKVCGYGGVVSWHRARSN